MFFKLCVVFLLLEIVLCRNPYTAEPGSDPKWMDRVHLFEKQAQLFGQMLKAVFLGDGFIDHWQEQGQQVWSASYRTLPTGNLGISGDGTENVLWRVENATISNVNPKVIVLMVGSVNIVKGDSIPDIAKGVRNILNVLSRILPDTKVILCSILPLAKADQNRSAYEVNKLISQFADNRKIFYLDLASHYVTISGRPKAELYDKEDLSLLGYKLWYQLMKPIFTKLIQ